MNIYVATQFQNAENAQKAMRQLKRAGHTITYDWTKDAQKVGSANPTDEKHMYIWQEFAQLDANGVRTADALIVLSVKNGGRGVYTELGMAIAHNIPCFIVGPYYNNIFYFMPQCIRVPDVNSAIKMLKTMG